MLERDYIMRLIQEFMAALERMLEKPEIEERRKEIQTLYDKYVGPYSFYHTATVEEALEALAGVDEEHRIGKIECSPNYLTTRHACFLSLNLICFWIKLINYLTILSTIAVHFRLTAETK